MEQNSDTWKIAFFGLLATGIIVANAIVGYRLFVSGEPSPAQPTPTSPAESTPAPTIDETNLIKQAIFRFTELDEERAEISINRNTGTYATGNIKEFSAVSGAYWLATKTGGSWIGVHAGQAQPTCAQIAMYDFPLDMVPECLDAGGRVVTR